MPAELCIEIRLAFTIEIFIEFLSILTIFVFFSNHCKFTSLRISFNFYDVKRT